MNIIQKPTIGLFVDAFYPMIDGVVVVVDQYARYLQSYANVIVFAPKSTDKTYVDNFPYTVYRSRQIKIPFTEYSLSLPMIDHHFQQALKHANLDLVHIHSPFSIGKMGIMYCKKKNIPVIGTLHSQYHLDFYERTRSELISKLALQKLISILNQCDELWTVNNYIKVLFEKEGIQKNICVIPNATELNYVQLPSKEMELKKQYNIRPDEKILLYVGRLDELKNLGFLLESLYRLRIKGFKFRMIFVGSGFYEEKMKTLIKKYGLQDHIHFTGRITNRQELSLHYKIADLFLFPSIYDSSSLVQIKAASQKTPTLFLKDTATSSTVTHNVNGYVSEHDSMRYAEMIIAIFKDYKTYLRVKEQCYKDLYLTWFDVTKIVYTRYQSHINHEKEV
jgi:glycosyltransferase involved in cell wall biosynthesis